MKLDQLQTKAVLRGLVSDALGAIVNVPWFGSEALELAHKTTDSKVANELLYRADQPRLKLVEQDLPRSFDGDNAMFLLVPEAQRVRLAHLLNPVLAMHILVVDPLPHQTTAVNDHILPRQRPCLLLPDFGVTSVNYESDEPTIRSGISS